MDVYENSIRESSSIHTVGDVPGYTTKLESVTVPSTEVVFKVMLKIVVFCEFFSSMIFSVILLRDARRLIGR